jgi:hypothetical protein
MNFFPAVVVDRLPLTTEEVTREWLTEALGANFVGV